MNGIPKNHKNRVRYRIYKQDISKLCEERGKTNANYDVLAGEFIQTIAKGEESVNKQIVDYAHHVLAGRGGIHQRLKDHIVKLLK